MAFMIGESWSDIAFLKHKTHQAPISSYAFINYFLLIPMAAEESWCEYATHHYQRRHDELL
jgi:hypothetical protein